MEIIQYLTEAAHSAGGLWSFLFLWSEFWWTSLNRNVFNKCHIFNLLGFIVNFMAQMIQEVYSCERRNKKVDYERIKWNLSEVCENDCP